MSLSRTARILIALLLVAAAAFVWVSYLRNAEPQTTLAGTPTVVPGAAAADAAANSPTATAAPLLAPGSEAIVGAPAGTPATSGPAAGTDPASAGSAAGTTDQPSPIAVPAAVVAPPTVVLRDLVVDDLPFLVTSPPAVETAEAEEDGGGATRPQAGRRGNINPFSPVLVQTAQTQPEPVFAEAPTSSPEPTVIVVNNDGTPPAGASATSSQPSTTVVAAQPAQAPAPRALAPASGGVGELPRPLPSGTLPITPDILRDARTASPVQSPTQAETPVAALVEPIETAQSELPPVGDGPAEDLAAPVEVLGPGQPNEAASEPAEPTEPVVATEPSAPTNVQKLPLVAGIDTLSRYLRDNDVRFTGTALGPLSVGVFRANHFEQPVVLTLGQSLPDTDIVLADLRGYEAKFSLGDSTQVLSLDLRR